MTQAPDPSDPSDPSTTDGTPVDAHSGQHAVAVARAHGVEAMFTLSGAHVFPMYDGAVTADPPMRLIDVRHEQTRDLRRRGHGQADPLAGPGGAHRRPGRDQRRQRDHPGPVQRVAAGRGRRPRPGQPVGLGVAAGARPAADPGLGHQVGTDPAHGRRGRPRPRRGLQPGRLLAPRAGLRRRADGRVLRPLHRRPTDRRPPRAHRARRRRPGRGRPAAGVERQARPGPRAPTSGPTGPRTPPCAWSRAWACRRSPTAWAAASSPAGTRCW